MHTHWSTITWNVYSGERARLLRRAYGYLFEGVTSEIQSVFFHNELSKTSAACGKIVRHVYASAASPPPRATARVSKPPVVALSRRPLRRPAGAHGTCRTARLFFVPWTDPVRMLRRYNNNTIHRNIRSQKSGVIFGFAALSAHSAGWSLFAFREIHTFSGILWLPVILYSLSYCPTSWRRKTIIPAKTVC